MKLVMEMGTCCGRYDLRTGTLIILWTELLLTIFNALTIGSRMKYTSEEGIAASCVVMSSVFTAVTCAVGLYGVGFEARRQSFLMPYVVVRLTSVTIAMTLDIILLVWWAIDPPEMEGLIDQIYLAPVRLSGNRPSALSARFLVFYTSFGIAFFSFVFWCFASVVYNYYSLLREIEFSSRSRSARRSFARTSVTKPDPNTVVSVPEG